MASRTVTLAATSWVPSNANCRRLSRRDSLCAIADEAVKNAGRAENDEQQRHRDGAADKPEDQRCMAMCLFRPATQTAEDDEGEQQREADHDHADEGEI